MILLGFFFLGMRDRKKSLDLTLSEYRKLNPYSPQSALSLQPNYSPNAAPAEVGFLA